MKKRNFLIISSIIVVFIIFLISLLIFLKINIPQVFADPRGEHYEFDFHFWYIKSFPAPYPTKENIWKWKIIKDCSILLIGIFTTIEIIITLVFLLKKRKTIR